MKGLLLLFLAASDATRPCGKLADVPAPSVDFGSPPNGTPLRRAYSLLELFTEGDGRFERVSTRGPALLAEGIGLYPLPWQSAPERTENLKLVTWQDSKRGNDENMPAIVLESGESWCTSTLGVPAGSRLRFEGVSIGRSQPAKLEVWSDRKDSLLSDTLPRPFSLDRSSQRDLAIPEGSRSLCFRAEAAILAIGEPRVLIPEASSSDARPRWLVLTIVDTLRGDMLRRKDASSFAPTLSHLAEGGRHYLNATSPGCHTRASVWPMLMGRDLLRVDPLQRRQSMPIQSPLEAIYSRANLFISHLAEAAGYHAVFLGNNAYLRVVPAFSRYSSWGRTDTGTIDTMEKIPELLSRYADERVLLVYYVSTPHAQSETPRRLWEELRCSERVGVDSCRCSYEARVRHADEAVAALQRGLGAYGLALDVIQIATADHGELFGDGMKLEGEIPTFATGERQGAFTSFDLGHGNACHERETDVPIVVHGKGIDPKKWNGVVSGLDIFPTLLELMNVASPAKLDGIPLPLTGGPALRRPIVSYGFCSDSSREGDEQLLWWVQGCRVREQGGSFLTHRAELWSKGRRVATDLTDPQHLRALMARHENWIQERLPSEAFVFGTEKLLQAILRITVENGRIVDYGPSASVYGLERIEVLGATDSELRLRFDDYKGLYHVSTLPPRARIRIEAEGHPEVVTFVGPLQLPLPIGGGAIDPSSDIDFLYAKAPPLARDSRGPALRFWWQGYGASETVNGAPQLSDFDRVLREWGYIR